MTRHYPDIRCQRCKQWTPAGSANQKWCPVCKKIKIREQRQAGNAKWKKEHGTAYAPRVHRDSAEHYIHGTTWTYCHGGICKRCRKDKDLNYWQFCRECYSIKSAELTGPDDVYQPDLGHISQMNLLVNPKNYF